MVYYSEKYAKKQKADRDVMVARANDLINHPKKYDRVTAKGSSAYVNLYYSPNYSVNNTGIMMMSGSKALRAILGHMI